MIPDHPNLRDSLAALSLEEVKELPPSGEHLVICDKSQRREADGTFFADLTEVVLKQSEGVPVRLNGLVEKVAESLHRAGHAHVEPKTPGRRAFGSIILAFAALRRESRDGTLDSLNQILEKIGETRVTQWAVLKTPWTEPEKYNFGDFEFGVMDSDLLRHRSERAGSDFAQRYGDEFRGRLALRRDDRTIRFANFRAIKRFPVLTSPSSLAYRLLDDYFGLLSDAERRRFLTDLDQQQAIYGAAGLGTIPSDFLRKADAFMDWIAVFTTQQRGVGWVVPTGGIPTMHVTSPGELAKGRAEIEAGLRISEWGTKGLDGTIQLFAEYLYTARNFEDDGRIEEALLHSVFALDLLLGGESGESLTAALAGRAAMVSHMALGKDFDEVDRFVRQSYDMRSGYVHRGERGNLSESSRDSLVDRYSRLKAICRAVLGAACFARVQPWSDHPDAKRIWLGRIDILIKKRDIGQSLDADEVGTLGLDKCDLDHGKIPGVTIRWAR
ncbi:hypothetical protein [Paludisphaera sp.]|uniref:hypothetical protein n=1 Tax=Paludisphaera sp. TaxID=2017432 RepID=UPI00301DEE7B